MVWQNMSVRKIGFKCEICDIWFARHDAYQKHLRARKHFSTRKSLKHPCNECGDSFSRKRALEQHLKSCGGPLGTPTKGPESTKWTDDSIKLLLSLVDEKKVHLPSADKKKRELWEEITADMCEVGYRYTWNAVSKKWFNLLDTYKKIKERRKKTGMERITWLYFEQFDELLGTTENKLPPSITFCSTSSDSAGVSGSITAKGHEASLINVPDSIEKLGTTTYLLLSNSVRVGESSVTKDSSAGLNDVPDTSGKSSLTSCSLSTNNGGLIDRTTANDSVVCSTEQSISNVLDGPRNVSEKRKSNILIEARKSPCIRNDHKTSVADWFREYTKKREKADQEWKADMKKILVDRNVVITKLADTMADFAAASSRGNKLNIDITH